MDDFTPAVAEDHPNKLAAKRFLINAIDNNGVPEKITIDGSAASKPVLIEYNNKNNTPI